MNQIKSTTEYSLFKRVWHNRTLDNAHFKNLTASIAHKNLLAYTPIIVNSSFEVIDGQHRLEVAKRNKLEIYYIVADEIQTADVLLLNANERPWSIQDFINSWIKQGKKDYVTLNTFMQEYSLPVTIIGGLLTGENSTTKLVREIKEGTFTVQREQSTREMCDKLVAIRPFCQYGCWRSRDFLRAFFSILSKVDWERFMERLQKIKESGTPQPFKRQVTGRDYTLMFEDVYNYDMKIRARLY